MGTFGQIFACRQRLERFLCHTAFRDDVIQGGAEFAGIVRDNNLRFRENPLHVAEGGPGADPDQLELRIRILSAMWREARDLAVLTDRYYERGYRRNVRYTI